MRIPNLFRTTAFRLTLLYAALFAVSVLVLLGFIYWNTINYLNAQTDQGIQTEMDGLLGQYRQQGLNNLRETLVQRGTAGRADGRHYLLSDSHYTILAGNLSEWPAGLRGRTGWAYVSVPELTREHDEQPDVHTSRALAFVLPDGSHLLVGRDLDERADFQEHTLAILLIAVGISLVLALLGGLVMSRGVLRRIETINRTSRSIMAGHLNKRVPIIGSHDEFDQLAINLNDMLDQIQRLMEGMRQVTENVAHDLRSPLSRLRSRLEITLLTPRSNEDYRTTIEQTLSDADGLLTTFNALLNIARVEAGAQRDEWVMLDFSALLHEVAEFYGTLAQEKGQRFIEHISSGLTLRGDRHLLAQAIGNLLDNAVKYTPAQGVIELYAGLVDGAIEIAICDNGPGIPAEAHEKVLRRFVRLEESRTTPGNGLGLSLVSAVAQLHRATLELSDNAPGLKTSLRFNDTSPIKNIP
ncbi:MAG: HAMP domain-containing sensor histidine kinase [Gammaproteobacteria bacterium]